MCVSQDSDPMNSILRRDTPEILRMHLVQNWIRERKRESGGIIQKGEPHERNPCALGFGEQPPEETSRQADCTSKVAWNLARQICKLKPNIKLRFILLWRRQRHRSANVYCVFGSFRIHNAEQGRFKLRCARKRGSTKFCSWSRSVHNSAITRWNASSSSASYALLRTRIFISVGKRWNSTNCPKMGRQLLVQWTIQYFSLCQDRHHIPAAFCLQHRDQRTRPIFPENWDYYQIQ